MTPRVAIHEGALTRQEGGDHYAKRSIQPFQYITANGLNFAEGSVVKYVTRWRDKGGVGDLRKAIHYLELLIEFEEQRQCSVLFAEGSPP